MFDKKLFSELLNKAKGDIKLVDFSNKTGIDRSYLSKYLNKRRNQPLQPAKLQSISDVSEGRVTYEELMVASGYIKSENEIILDNIKMIMGGMSFVEFAQTIEQRLGSAYSIAYPPSYFKDILQKKEVIDNNGLSMLANFVGVDVSFFLKENTLDDLERSKEDYNKLKFEQEKTTSTIDDYIKLIKILISEGIDMEQYKDIFSINNIKYLDQVLKDISNKNKI